MALAAHAIAGCCRTDGQLGPIFRNRGGGWVSGCGSRFDFLDGIPAGQCSVVTDVFDFDAEFNLGCSRFGDHGSGQVFVLQSDDGKSHLRGIRDEQKSDCKWHGCGGEREGCFRRHIRKSRCIQHFCFVGHRNPTGQQRLGRRHPWTIPCPAQPQHTCLQSGDGDFSDDLYLHRDVNSRRSIGRSDCFAVEQQRQPDGAHLRGCTKGRDECDVCRNASNGFQFADRNGDGQRRGRRQDGDGDGGAGGAIEFAELQPGDSECAWHIDLHGDADSGGAHNRPRSHLSEQQRECGGSFERDSILGGDDADLHSDSGFGNDGSNGYRYGERRGCLEDLCPERVGAGAVVLGGVLAIKSGALADDHLYREAHQGGNQCGDRGPVEQQHRAAGGCFNDGTFWGDDWNVYGYGHYGSQLTDGDPDSQAWRCEQGDPGDGGAGGASELTELQPGDGECTGNIDLYGDADSGGARIRLRGYVSKQQRECDGAVERDGSLGSDNADVPGDCGLVGDESDSHLDGERRRRLQDLHSQHLRARAGVGRRLLAVLHHIGTNDQLQRDADQGGKWRRIPGDLIEQQCGARGSRHGIGGIRFKDCYLHRHVKGGFRIANSDDYRERRCGKIDHSEGGPRHAGPYGAQRSYRQGRGRADQLELDSVQ